MPDAPVMGGDIRGAPGGLSSLTNMPAKCDPTVTQIRPFRGIFIAFDGEKMPPWAMAKSGKSLVIVGNAFEREKRRQQAAPRRVMWTRHELSDLLNVYGRQVAAGEWRDYAIADGAETARFDIFRRASEVPLYRVEKSPALRKKQGQYILRAMDGRVLRRGHELAALLRFFDKKTLYLID